MMKKIVLSVIGSVLLFFFVLILLGYYFTGSFYDEQYLKLGAVYNNKPLVQDTSGLPAPVKKYLDRVVLRDFQILPGVVTKQSGLFRTSAGAKWSEITATQQHTISEPGFLWDGEINFLPGLWVRGIDSYINGTGNMLIKLNSSLTISDASGEQMDISALGRYVSEMPLFPISMFESKNVSWEPIDPVSARMIFTDKKNTIKMDFFFNNEGLIYKAVTLDRFLTSNAGYIQTPYTIHYGGYKNLDGCLVPTEVSVEWNTTEGDFEYGKFVIDEVSYLTQSE